METKQEVNNKGFAPLLKIPEFEDSGFNTDLEYFIHYKMEIMYNNSYFYRHCETRLPNSDCYYLTKGCKGPCVI